MNREIKFRAWDKENGMFDITTLNWDKEGYLYKNGHILMQFTGLHDKNGKEIFEGDVLDWNTGHGQSSVVWLQNGCWGTSKGNPLGIAAKMSEVIGNVYENPELLTAETHSE